MPDAHSSLAELSKEIVYQHDHCSLRLPVEVRHEFAPPPQSYTLVEHIRLHLI